MDDFDMGLLDYQYGGYFQNLMTVPSDVLSLSIPLDQIPYELNDQHRIQQRFVNSAMQNLHHSGMASYRGYDARMDHEWLAKMSAEDD
jgi:hypothetical protein